MKRSLLCTFGFVVFAVVAFGANPAGAASGAGPYYATPSWDQTLSAATRFVVLTNMNSEAVLDRETGLVWEKEPSTTAVTWFNASIHCLELTLGGRDGWRLPALPELKSLVDPTQFNPALPAGRPFTVQDSVYWSATTNAGNPTNAWLVFFRTGGGGNFDKSLDFAGPWCVRGGPGGDTQ
jgi:hypothetical protein